MTRPMPEHGTRARYHRGCRCPACVAEHSRYCKLLAYQTLNSGPRTASVDAAAAHLRQLDGQGWTCDQIAHAAGVTPRSISKILRGEQKKASHEMLRRILAADPSRLNQERRGLVSAVGFLRRGRALIAIGHNNQRIADALGISHVVLSRLLIHDAPTIKATTADAMARLYDAWSAAPGPSKRARTIAAQRGWHGPLAWDDIDDPNAQPESDAPEPAPEVSKRELFLQLAEERRTEIRLLASAGNQPAQIAQRVGLSEQTVRRTLASNHPALYLELTA